MIFLNRESESDFPCGASMEDLIASLACRDKLKRVNCLKCKKLILIPLEQGDERCDSCRVQL
ncbi:MAG: hypothetical protein QXJ68_06650 [Methanocellales archaeon]